MSGVLVDTSAWVLALNRKDAVAKRRLNEAIAAGVAACCPVLMLELLVGRSKAYE